MLPTQILSCTWKLGINWCFAVFKYPKFEIKKKRELLAVIISHGTVVLHHMHHMLCMVEWPGWGDTGPFLQHGGNSQTIVGSSDGLLPHAQHLMQKNGHYVYGMNRQWLPSFVLRMRCTGFCRKGRNCINLPLMEMWKWTTCKLDVCLSMHHCICIEKKNQLDVTVCFITLMKRSTCFSHFYAYHQGL